MAIYYFCQILSILICNPTSKYIYQLVMYMIFCITIFFICKMLSKEQKLQYGEFLRQQMRQRQGTKRGSRRQQGSVHEEQNNPPQIIQPQNLPPSIPKSPPINPAKFTNQRELQKQMLAKKMQSIDYNPFGKIGGGAPNKHLYGLNSKESQPINQNNKENYSKKRNYSLENDKKVQHGQQYQLPQPQRYGPGPNPAMMYQMQSNQPYQPDQYKRISTPQFLQGAYNNAQFISPQFAPPAPYGYVAQENNINYLGKIQLPPQPKLPFEPSFQQMKANNFRQLGQHEQTLQNYNMRQHQTIVNQNKPLPIPPPAQNIETAHISEAEQQIFKKGGRNLLNLQNKTTQEIMAKQNQKLRLQQELKKQMEEVARKKKEEQMRIRQQDERLQRKKREFLQRQNLKYQEQLKGKKDMAKNIEQVNGNAGKPNEPPMDLKKQKFKKIRQQVAKRQSQQRKQLNPNPVQQKENKDTKNIRKQPDYKNSNELDEVASVISSDTQLSRGFNTAISKQFFRKERQKGKLQKVTEQISKMRKQIAHQGYQYHEQIQKLQRQADYAKREKEQADNQILRLKKQLRDKMDINNKKYLEDIYRGKVQMKDPYYADQMKLEQKDVNTLKPRPTEHLVLKQYKPQPFIEPPQGYSNQLPNNSDMMSLIGDSKKIPLDIDPSDSMTISKLGKFAKQTQYFQGKRQSNSPMNKKYRPNQSIQELDQQRVEESRQSKRNGHQKPQEELDMLIQSRKKSRGGWGQMSSVNDQIVDQIQKMIGNRQSKQRPKSHLSTAGQRVLINYQKDKNQNTINEQEMMKRKKSESYGRQNEGSSNTLDQLLNKYI